MANEFQKPQSVLDASVLLLEREIVLPRLVWRQTDGNFVYEKDDTFTLKIPPRISADDVALRGTDALSFKDIVETAVPVQLTRDVRAPMRVTDAQLRLDIVDFTRTVMMTGVRSCAEQGENLLAAAMTGATPMADDVPFVEGTDEFFDVAIKLRRELNKLNVPRGDRYIVLGADVEAAAFGDDKLVKSNEAGTDDALREAIIGRVAGFTVVGSNAVPDDFGCAFHRTAIAWGSVSPSPSASATWSASTESESFSMRLLRQFNMNATGGPAEEVLINSFVGVTSVDEDDGASGEANYRLVKIDFTAAGGS